MVGGTIGSMDPSFTGWTEDAFALLERLEGDPLPSVREAERKAQERLVRAPMIALMEELARADEAYEDFSVWSPGRATLWGWQAQGTVIRVAPSIELSVTFTLDGLFVRGAWFYPQPGQLDRFRRAVAGERSGRRLASILAALAEQGCELSGDLMKRMPRGYPPDHPRAELLRHRSVLANRWLGSGAWLQTAEPVERVRVALGELSPLMQWCVQHLD